VVEEVAEVETEGIILEMTRPLRALADLVQVLGLGLGPFVWRTSQGLPVQVAELAEVHRSTSTAEGRRASPGPAARAHSRTTGILERVKCVVLGAVSSQTLYLLLSLFEELCV
jgi:hypothetical protein